MITEETPEEHGRWERLKDWWWALCIAGFVIGCIATGFGKFTIYYLAEQNSVLTLDRQGKALNGALDRITANEGALTRINQTLSEQHYANQTVDGKLADLAEHVHALDARADNDRAMLNDFLATQRKNTEQILWLLDHPKDIHK
jgi:hypothetical protein